MVGFGGAEERRAVVECDDDDLDEPIRLVPVTSKPSVQRPSAAERIKSLLIDGKLSDDEIFAALRREYGLDGRKSGIVGWYRNRLQKIGKLKG